MKNLIQKIVTTTALIFCVTSALAEEAKNQPDFEVTEVSSGIYMLSGVGGFVGGNVGLSIGEDGVVMIDDAMPPFLDKMKNAVKTVTNDPIAFLINTHVHGDHTGNNQSFGEQGVRIVAHENLRTAMLNKGLKLYGKEGPMPKAALPVITFSHAMSFHLNGEDARVFHVKNAHTDGDAVIHFKNSNVIHTGDTFFNGLFPYIDLANGGSVDGYIAAQQQIIDLSNDNTKIIPGHGPLSNKKQLQIAVSMLLDAKDLITNLIEKGQSEEQVVKANPLKKYHKKWNWEFIPTEKMTRQVFKSLNK
ncbi:MAG: MBL fold metallo-hydrolase [Kangiellaceae bacterium]|nr:MBL fold metallo-hydrolase [Kangiellaceae bacterium]